MAIEDEQRGFLLVDYEFVMVYDFAVLHDRFSDMQDDFFSNRKKFRDRRI